jgi:hypothetical protein
MCAPSSSCGQPVDGNVNPQCGPLINIPGDKQTKFTIIVDIDLDPDFHMMLTVQGCFEAVAEACFRSWWLKLV